MSNFERPCSNREQFADLGIMESCPTARAHASYLASASPLSWAVSLEQSFGEGASAPLSGDKQSYRCTDQNQKSRKGRHNAYLFKDGDDPPPDANAYTASKNNDRARLRLLSDCRHRESKFGTGRIGPQEKSSRAKEQARGNPIY